MKYLALTALLTFSLSSFADDLSFGSFSVGEKAQAQETVSTDQSFASFEVKDLVSRNIASVEEAPAVTVDPVAFGSFE